MAQNESERLFEKYYLSSSPADELRANRELLKSRSFFCYVAAFLLIVLWTVGRAKYGWQPTIPDCVILGIVAVLVVSPTISIVLLKIPGGPDLELHTAKDMQDGENTPS